MLWFLVVIISVVALTLPFVIVLALLFGKDLLFKDNGDSDNIKYGSARPIVARGILQRMKNPPSSFIINRGRVLLISLP